MWKFNLTQEHIRCSEKLKISDEVSNAIERWAVTVSRIQTNRQKHYFRSPNNIFEIWVARIPNFDTNIGNSGGFRLVYFLNLKESSIYIDKIEKRANIGTKKERPKDQKRFANYLKDLKNIC